MALVTGTLSASGAGTPVLRKAPSKVFTPGSVTPYTDFILGYGPKAFWPLQDASGNPVDVSGNALDFTSVTGSPTYQDPGPGASDFSIGTTNDQLVKSSEVSTVINNFTLQLWVNNLGVGSNNIQMFFNGSGSTGWGIYIDTNRKFKYIASGINFGASSALALTDSVWYFLNVIRRSGTWEYYVNNALDTSNAGTDTPNTPSAGFVHIGETGGYDAQFAYAAIYEYALSLTDIEDQYDALNGIVTDGATGNAILKKTPQIIKSPVITTVPRKIVFLSRTYTITRTSIPVIGILKFATLAAVASHVCKFQPRRWGAGFWTTATATRKFVVFSGRKLITTVERKYSSRIGDP